MKLIPTDRNITVFILIKIVPYIISELGLHALFLFHGAVCALAVLFVWCLVPETKGKTLSELCSIYK